MGIQIKKFQAQTLQKAIEQVRAELGDNAVILQTETIRGQGLMGKSTIEVTAAIDQSQMTPRFELRVDEKSDERLAPAKPKTSWTSLFRSAPAAKDVKTPAVKTAAKPVAAPAAAQPAKADPTSSVSQLYAMKTFVEPLQKEIESLKARLKPDTAMPLPTTQKRKVRDPLEDEVLSLRSELTAFINERRFERAKLPRFYQQLCSFWISRGMSNRQLNLFFRDMEKWGNRFDAEVSDQEAARSLMTVLEGAVKEARVLDREGQRIVVLVGPTGVGKTTTIAKLGAFEKLRRGRNVCFITLDDFKVGGIDQMGHYARILEVPFYKPRTDMSLEDQCRIEKADTIFVDTYGVSATDDQRIEKLKKTLTFLDPEMKRRLEIHLVLPTGISNSDVRDTLKHFESLHPQYLMFTKWDETQNWGGMLAAILQSGLPVSFMTNGQSVPDDLMAFSRQDFIEKITHLTESQDHIQ